MIHETTIFRRKELLASAKDFLTEEMLLFDIETTGLSPARDAVYCIGCGYLSGEEIRVELFFAENRQDEAEVLGGFFALAQQFPLFVTFNGTTFDLPFLLKRGEALLPGTDFCAFLKKQPHIDLYREARGMKNLLCLSSYKQKSIEHFLGIDREDPYSGGELIEFYHRYEKDPDPETLEPILLHNREDVRGMFDLASILAYRQFADGAFEITDISGEEDGAMRFLNVILKPDAPLPGSIHRIAGDPDGISFLLDKKSALFRFPIHHGELKQYFSDVENYYYLPEEDTAIHRSVGEFVDPSHRVRATKKTCYVKKECDYLCLPGNIENAAEALELPVRKTDLAALICRFMSEAV